MCTIGKVKKLFFCSRNKNAEAIPSLPWNVIIDELFMSWLSFLVAKLKVMMRNLKRMLLWLHTSKSSSPVSFIIFFNVNILQITLKVWTHLCNAHKQKISFILIDENAKRKYFVNFLVKLGLCCIGNQTVTTAVIQGIKMVSMQSMGNMQKIEMLGKYWMSKLCLSKVTKSFSGRHFPFWDSSIKILDKFKIYWLFW